MVVTLTVNVRIGFSKSIAELARVLHFRHKSADMEIISDLSLLEHSKTYQEQNLVQAQEIESFNPLLRVVSTHSTVGSHSD